MVFRMIANLSEVYKEEKWFIELSCLRRQLKSSYNDVSNKTNAFMTTATFLTQHLPHFDVQQIPSISVSSQVTTPFFAFWLVLKLLHTFVHPFSKRADSVVGVF